jgi:hypothetical protein
LKYPENVTADESFTLIESAVALSMLAAVVLKGLVVVCVEVLGIGQPEKTSLFAVSALTLAVSINPLLLTKVPGLRLLPLMLRWWSTNGVAVI